MTLQPNEKAWCPEDQEQYLCILRPGQRPPQNRKELAALQEQLAMRLQEEANEGELREADRMLENNLPVEYLNNLPGPAAKYPHLAACLARLPAPEGTRLHEWKVEMEEAVTRQPMTNDEARELAEELTLEGWLGRVL